MLQSPNAMRLHIAKPGDAFLLPLARRPESRPELEQVDDIALDPKAQADFVPDPQRHPRFTVVGQELGNPGALQVWEHRWLAEETVPLSNGSRLSCGALKKDSFLNLRAPPASSAC